MCLTRQVWLLIFFLFEEDSRTKAWIFIIDNKILFIQILKIQICLTKLDWRI